MPTNQANESMAGSELVSPSPRYRQTTLEIHTQKIMFDSQSSIVDRDGTGGIELLSSI